MNKKARLLLRDEKRIRNRKLLRVFSNYLAKKSEYDQQTGMVKAKIEKVTKTLRKLNQELDGLGQGTFWVRDLLEPIARVLSDALELKTGVKRSWEILGPFGLSCSTSIHFYPLDHSRGQKEPGKKWKEPTGLSITFRPGNTDVAELYVVDYSKDLGHYAVGSLGQINGLNYAQVAVKRDTEWLLGFVR